MSTTALLSFTFVALTAITPGLETLLVLRTALLDAFGSRRCRMHGGMVPFSDVLRVPGCP